MDGILRLPGEGETVTDNDGRTLRILLAHELADVTWARYEAGERGPQPHVHREHVDAFYVLEGELELGLGREAATVVSARAGTFVLVPPNVVHMFGNTSGANRSAPLRPFQTRNSRPLAVTTPSSGNVSANQTGWGCASAGPSR